jgi:proline dehydrogenase
VIQSYLRHRRNDFKELIASGSRIRLVNGGCLEPGAVVYRDRRDIDGVFAADMELLVEPGAPLPAMATYDARLIERAQMIARARGLGNGDYEFQMLYGVKPQLQK